MLHWWRLAGTHNLQSYNANINSTWELKVALVEMGRDSLPVSDTSMVGSEWRVESSIDNRVVLLSFLGTLMTLEAVIEVDALCLQLLEKRYLDTIVLLVPKSDECDVISEAFSLPGTRTAKGSAEAKGTLSSIR